LSDSIGHYVLIGGLGKCSALLVTEFGKAASLLQANPELGIPVYAALFLRLTLCIVISRQWQSRIRNAASAIGVGENNKLSIWRNRR
jgi:hypothetical protein